MNNTETKLELLQQTYAKNLPEKIQEIESIWFVLRENWSSKKLSELYRKIRSLHGSAGILGFNKLAEIAETLDKQISNLPNKNLPSYEDKRIIQELLKKIKIISQD